MFADDLKWLASQGIREAQNLKEAARLIEFAHRDAPTVYLEIGARHGWTFHIVSQAMADNSLLIAVDLPGVYPWGDPNSERNLMAVVEMAQKRHRAHVIFGNSTHSEVQQAVKWHLNGRQVDWLFIDGDHKYAGVRADFDNYAPLVRQGGQIILHDIHGKPKTQPEKNPEVFRLWEELTRRYKSHEISLGGPGLGIITYAG